MARFSAPVEYKRTSSGGEPRISRYAGIPVGIQLFSDWDVYYNPFAATADFDQTNDWAVTEVDAGAAGSIALTDDLSPGGLVFINGAGATDSQEAQYTAAGGGGELWLLTGDRPLYFETMIRLRDAGNVDAAVEEVRWFVGLGITDTTFQAGATDFIGFHKRDLGADATGQISFVCGDAGGAGGLLVDQFVSATGWVALNPVEVQATDRANRVQGANQWLKLAFLIEPTASGAQGNAYAWVNNVLTPNSPMDVAGFIPDTEVCVTLCVENGEAVVKQMDVAYVLVAQSFYDDAGVMV